MAKYDNNTGFFQSLFCTLIIVLSFLLISDTEWSNFIRAGKTCVYASVDRRKRVEMLQEKWMPSHNPNHVFIGLSVRTLLDLYLRVMNFPPGSEVIISAITIPDVIHILHHHQLKIVSLDISIESTAPKLKRLTRLITDQTVAIIITHIFGKWFDTVPFVEIAKEYNLKLIEDCAETFCGFDQLGNVETDLALFSFGSIKYSTAFGGGIAKVKNSMIYNKMCQIHNTYPRMSHIDFLSKILYVHIAYCLLNCPSFIKPTMYILKQLNVDYKKHVVGLLRGFPNELIMKIRQQPCDSQIDLLCHR